MLDGERGIGDADGRGARNAEGSVGRYLRLMAAGVTLAGIPTRSRVSVRDLEPKQAVTLWLGAALGEVGLKARGTTGRAECGLSTPLSGSCPIEPMLGPVEKLDFAGIQVCLTTVTAVWMLAL